MPNWNNDTGRPLASSSWLEAHHQAKLPERRAFATLIAKKSPLRIVDLGCGPGLWLELLSDLVSPDCEFFGIDSDPESLETAEARARLWPQSSKFITLDFETQANDLPTADIYLAFNVFPYIAKPQKILSTIKSKLRPGGCLIVRQYDGALLRMGPMDKHDRQLIDMSLMTSVAGSDQFKHYDLDRVFQALEESPFNIITTNFEIFKRISPYPPEFQDYLFNTIDWTRMHISDEARDRLDAWCGTLKYGASNNIPSYFMEVDLVAWLS